MHVAFSIDGVPQGKERARTVRVRGRPLTFTPTKTRRYERTVGLLALTARPDGWPLDARYLLTLRVFWPDARRRDLSNLQKSIEDGANGILWRDDAQIVATSCTGAIDRDHPRAEVLVEVAA